MKRIIQIKNYIPKEVFPKQGARSKKLIKKDFGDFHSLTCSNSRIQTMIPKLIHLEDSDFVAIGLYLAEGYTKVNFNAKYYHDGSVTFAGSYQEMLEPVCSLLEKLGIPRAELSWKIGLNRNIQTNHEEEIEFWVRNVKLNVSKLRKNYFTGKKRAVRSTGEKGCVHLFFPSVVFRSFFINFVQKIFNECLTTKDKEKLALILKGFFAGDGNVNYCKKYNRKQVDFACNNLDLINKLKQALHIVGLKSVKETFPERTKAHNKSLRIYNLHDFQLLHKYEVLNLLDYKKRIFLGILKSY